MSRTTTILIALGLGACSFQPRQGGATGDADVEIDAAVVVPRCDAPPAFDFGLTPASTIFVASGGSASPDGTMTNPYGSIQAALSGRAPGTRIELLAGTYSGEQLDDLHGTATAPFWIEGPSSGPRAQLTSPLVFGSPRFVVVRHLDLTTTSGRPLSIDDSGNRQVGTSHHVAVEDVSASGPATSDCVVVAGVADLSFDRVETNGCRVGVRMVGVHRAVLARLRPSNAVFAGVAVSGGSDQIEIRQSVITNAERGVWLGGTSSEDEFRPPLTATNGNFEVANARVLNNVITGPGIEAVACSHCRDVVIAGNLMKGAWMRAGRLIDEHGAIGAFNFELSGKMTWINNAIELGGAATPFLVDSGTDPASCGFSHNLWNGTTEPPLGEPGVVRNTPSGYDATGQLCTGAAAHAGVVVPQTPGTFDGDCRPEPPSIGPDEPAPGC